MSRSGGVSIEPKLLIAMSTEVEVERAWFRLTDTVSISEEIPDITLFAIRKAFGSGYRTALSDLHRMLTEDRG